MAATDGPDAAASHAPTELKGEGRAEGRTPAAAAAVLARFPLVASPHPKTPAARRASLSREYLGRKEKLAAKRESAPLVHLKALAEDLVPLKTVYSPRELGWEVPGARRLTLAASRDTGWEFSVQPSSRAENGARRVLLDWIQDGKIQRPLLRMLDADGRLLRWELSGKEGAEGEFDERGALAVGRSWLGDEQTVMIRAFDGPNRPQLRFHKYRKGRKVSVRVVTLDPETQRAAEIREYDAAGELVRLARITKEGKAEVSEPVRKLASKPPPPARPQAARLPPKPPVKAPAPPTPKPPPPTRPPPTAQATTPPGPRPMFAPPGTLLSAAADGVFATPEEVLRRFGPTVGQSRKLVVQGPAGPETWLVRQDTGGRKLMRADVENELLMREIVRSFYGDVFETAPAVGFEAGKRAALLEKVSPAAPAPKSLRPFSPRERAALATLSLVFGLVDLGPEHFVWREGHKPLLVGLGGVRRNVFKLADEERPLVAVEIRLGRVPFVRISPPLEREEYREEARRIEASMQAPGFVQRLRPRLERTGLAEAQAKDYLDAAAANLARFEASLEPYLEAAASLEELTDSGG